MRSKEEIIFSKNAQMTGHKIRCWCCRHMYINKDATFGCIKYKSNDVNFVPDYICPIDGSRKE